MPCLFFHPSTSWFGILLQKLEKKKLSTGEWLKNRDMLIICLV
jgi:hypothetical protein